MDKDNRKQDIKRIISTQKISGQDELLVALKNMGYELTQATLSRDIKEMGIAKMPDHEKGYIYVLPKNIGHNDRMSMNTPNNSIVSVEFSYNFGIIKTLPGFASSISIFIDSLDIKEIAGTIAGDDTILIIPREPHTKNELWITLQRIFPKLSLV
ncbi:MAG: ArgR family transcriptional regulator [Bacteroidales bacterium]|nr:MAG: ArgR family transcriptional regulator [Bacteroidales bacterium]